MARLLAIDLGLRTGLAVFTSDGRLERYRSQNFGTVTRLRRAAWAEVHGIEELAALAVEGDASLARVWAKAAVRRGARVFAVRAETWRAALMTPRQRRDGPTAKATAARLARRHIEDCGLPAPTALRHDAAEAVCIGLWACRRLGW